jgi:hypothetical protein
MSEERLRLMGRLETEKLKAEELKLKMSGLIKSIRNLLDGYMPLELLECQVAAQQAMELAVPRHFPGSSLHYKPNSQASPWPRRPRQRIWPHQLWLLKALRGHDECLLQAIASRPFFCTKASSLREGPRGCFSPLSHWLTSPTVTFR